MKRATNRKRAAWNAKRADRFRSYEKWAKGSDVQSSNRQDRLRRAARRRGGDQ